VAESEAFWLWMVLIRVLILGQMLDVTELLLEHNRRSGKEGVSLVLESQTICMSVQTSPSLDRRLLTEFVFFFIGVAWSSALPFQTSPIPTTVDRSFLVCGTRAGTLVFLQFNEGSLEVSHVAEVANTWVTNISCSSWAPKDGDTCE
jgi:hypothetical protein